MAGSINGAICNPTHGSAGGGPNRVCYRTRCAANHGTCSAGCRAAHWGKGSAAAASSAAHGTAATATHAGSQAAAFIPSNGKSALCWRRQGLNHAIEGDFLSAFQNCLVKNHAQPGLSVLLVLFLCFCNVTHQL